MNDVERIMVYLETLRVGCNSVALDKEIRCSEGENSWYSVKGDELMEVLITFLKEECSSFSPNWK